MSYTLPPNSPTITLASGKQYAVAAVDAGGIVAFWAIGVFEKGSDGWNMLGTWALIISPDQMLITMKNKGSFADFMSWLMLELKKILIDIFTPVIPTPPSGEPTTDAEVLAAIIAYLGTKKLVINSSGALDLV